MSETVEKLKQQLAEQEARAAKFERLHAEGMVEHEVRKAAKEAGAFNADQVLPYLKPHGKLVEVDGKQVVRIASTNEDGQEILHTPAEAVGIMKRTKDFENFFPTASAPSPPPAGPPKLDFKNMTPEQYLKIRAEHPEWLGLDPLRNRRR